MAPRLLPRSELLDEQVQPRFVALDGDDVTLDLPPGSLAFTYCQVPIIYRAGDTAAIELERSDGRREFVPGSRLDSSASAAILGRDGSYRRVTVTIPRGTLHPS